MQHFYSHTAVKNLLLYNTTLYRTTQTQRETKVYYDYNYDDYRETIY